MDAIDVRHHHVSLAVLGLDAQLAWYAENLGFTEVVERFELPEPPVRTAVIRTASGLRLEMIERAGASPRSFDDPLAAAGVQGYGHWAIRVVDLDAAFGSLTEHGASAVSAPAPAVRPGDRFAYVKDPEGNLLELIQTIS